MPVDSAITQITDHFSYRVTSQLIKGISIVLEKLKYFNAIFTAISTSFLVLSAGVLPVALALNVNDSDFTMLSFGISLWYCHKLPVFNHGQK